MKQGSFSTVRFIVFLVVLVGMTAFPLVAQEPTVSLQTIILERFNGETVREWSFQGRTHEFDLEWRTDASRFASQIDGESFPQTTFVQAWPQALFGSNREGNDLQSFGIWGKFDRQGFNWVDVYPVRTGSDEPFEIPIPGRVRALDMWVWGSNLNYELEAYVRDHRGVVHSINMGSIAFTGWRNMQVRIPATIMQSRRVLPSYAGLHFVKFRIWTTPPERVDNFFVYFNQLKVLTDVFETLFDGNDLADPVHVQELWGQNQTPAQ